MRAIIDFTVGESECNHL